MHTKYHVQLCFTHRYMYTPEIPDLHELQNMRPMKMGRLFADYTRKDKCKTNAFTIFARHTVFLHLFVFTPRSRYMPVTYAPGEPRHGYFDYEKNPKTHKFSSMPGSRWCRFWYLWCISVALPHCTHPNCSDPLHRSHILQFM